MPQLDLPGGREEARHQTALGATPSARSIRNRETQSPWQEGVGGGLSAAWGQPRGEGANPAPPRHLLPRADLWRSFPSGFGLRFAPSHETGLASPVPGPRARRCRRGWTDRHLEGRCRCAHTWLCSGWRRRPGGCVQRGRNGTHPSVFPGPPDPGPPWAAEGPHTGRRSGAAGGSESGGRGCLGWGAAPGSPIQGPPHVWAPTERLRTPPAQSQTLRAAGHRRAGRGGRSLARHPARRGTPLAGEGHLQLTPAPRPPSCPLPGARDADSETLSVGHGTAGS